MEIYYNLTKQVSNKLYKYNYVCSPNKSELHLYGTKIFKNLDIR